MKTFSVVQSAGDFRPVTRIALPALAEEFLVLMVTWTDWFLASRYFVEDGDATKAAMGLMAYVMWLIPTMFTVVAIGATALIARWVGANGVPRASWVANQAYLVGGFISILLTAAMLRWGEDFIALMQLQGEAADFALQYLRIVTPTIPFIMFSQIGAACLHGAGDTFSSFVVKIVVVVVNVLVSTSLVVGWGPLPTIGWQGIAIGTAAGYLLGGSLTLAILIRGRAGLQLRLQLLKPEWLILGRLFKIGLPGGFDMATLLVSQLLFLGLINRLGKAAAAAHGLAVQIEASAFLPGAAFQAAAATMAGQFIGAQLPRRALSSVLLCLMMAAAIMISGAVILYFYGINIAAMFTGDPLDRTTVQVAMLLKIVAFAMPSLAVVMVLSGGFRGAGDTVWPFAFTAVGFFLVRIPLAIYFCFETFEIPWAGVSIHGLGWGVAGAWYAMAIDIVARSLLVGYRFCFGRWREVRI